MIFTGERLHPKDIGGINEFRYKIALKSCKGKKVLDLGCAFGYGSYLLSRNGAKRVLAYDADEEAINFAKSNFSNSNIEYKVARIEDIRLRGKFDVVTSFEVIEHLVEPQKLLYLVSSILKRNGRFFISTPNRLKSSYDGDKPSNPYHVKEYFPEEFEKLLKKYFSKVALHGIGLKTSYAKAERKVKSNLRWKIASILVKKRLVRRLINFLPAGPKRLFTGEKNLNFGFQDFVLKKKRIKTYPYLLAICLK